jgi:Raf kinase inhibitor-like YbhB/YbcL family protein
MKITRLLVAAAAAVAAVAVASAAGLTIGSPAFPNNGEIPAKYTCDGAGPNPALEFGGVPAKAKSLALIVEDPDVPRNLKADGMFDHWVLWDIAPDAKGIAEGAGKGGINETGSAGYFGPCPPDREHRYFFKLFALDMKLTGAKISSKKDLEKAMEGHILDRAELVGKYKRP